MRADVVKQPRIVALATLVALVAVMVARLLHTPNTEDFAIMADMPLGVMIDGFFGDHTALSSTVLIVLMLVNGALIARIIYKYDIIKTHALFPIILYVLLSGPFTMPSGPVTASLLSMLLVVSSEQMIASFKRAYTFNNVFNSGFCLGIMPLIYSASLPLMLVLPVTLMLYRRTLREWIAALAGLCLPLLLASTGCWMAGYEWGSLVDYLFGDAFTMNDGHGIVGALSGTGITTVYIHAGLSAVMLLLSIAAIIAGAHTVGVRIRKIYLHFICLALISATTLILPSGSIAFIILAAIPATVIFMAFFAKFRGWLTLSLYVALIATVVSMNIMAFN